MAFPKYSSGFPIVFQSAPMVSYCCSMVFLWISQVYQWIPRNSNGFPIVFQGFLENPLVFQWFSKKYSYDFLLFSQIFLCIPRNSYGFAFPRMDSQEFLWFPTSFPKSSCGSLGIPMVSQSFSQVFPWIPRIPKFSYCPELGTHGPWILGQERSFISMRNKKHKRVRSEKCQVFAVFLDFEECPWESINF